MAHTDRVFITDPVINTYFYELADGVNVQTTIPSTTTVDSFIAK